MHMVAMAPAALYLSPCCPGSERDFSPRKSRPASCTLQVGYYAEQSAQFLIYFYKERMIAVAVLDRIHTAVRHLCISVADGGARQR